MRALLVLCLLGHPAAADDLPAIDSPALRITSSAWNVRLERVGVAIRSAPEVTFVTLALTGREHDTTAVDIKIPTGTQVIGLGFDGKDKRVWGRALPRAHVVGRLMNGGALLVADDTSLDADSLTLHVTLPATIELALHLPPIPSLAIETTASVLVVDVDGEKLANKRKRLVVDLADVAGTGGDLSLPHVTQTVALLAAPASPTDFLQPIEHRRFGHHHARDVDKAMIRRRMKWFRPGLRQCFMHEAQWNGLRKGGAVMSFMILASGSVDWATATESDLPASVNACLVDQILRWEFPAADGNVQVNYPLTFGVSE